MGYMLADYNISWHDIPVIEGDNMHSSLPDRAVIKLKCDNMSVFKTTIQGAWLLFLLSVSYPNQMDLWFIETFLKDRNNHMTVSVIHRGEMHFPNNKF